MNDPSMKNSRIVRSPGRRVLLTSLVVFLIGCTGYFTLSRGDLSFYIAAHLGASGVLGMIGGAVGLVARRKGRAFWPAFLLGCFLPIAGGLVAVALLSEMTCGGSVSLAIAILVAIIYAFLSKRTMPVAS